MNAISGPTFPLLDDITKAVHEDPKTQTLIKRLQEGTCLNPNLQWRNDLIFWGNRIYIPDNIALRNKIIAEFHDSKTGGHSRIKGTIKRIASNFYLPKLASTVQNFVKQCTTYLPTKPETPLIKDYYNHYLSPIIFGKT